MKWSWEFIKSIESITYNIKLSFFIVLGAMALNSFWNFDLSIFCFYIIIGCTILSIIDVIRNWMVSIILNQVNKETQELLDSLDNPKEKNDKEL